MGESVQVPAFAEECSKGHRLSGRVKYCPFCGVTVVHPDTAKGQADRPSMQPATLIEPQKNNIDVPIQQPGLKPEIKVTVAEQARREVSSSIPEPIEVSAPEPEQPTQATTEQESFPPGVSQPATQSSSAEKTQDGPKPFPKGKLAAASVVVLLILIWMFGGGQTKTPGVIVVTESTRPAIDTSPAPVPTLPKKSAPKKMLETPTAAEQRPSVPVVIPPPASPRQEEKPKLQVNEKVTELPASPKHEKTPQPQANEKVTELLTSARKYIVQGNYKGAEEAMKFCGMIDSENQECQQIKQKAARLNNQMFDCVSAGREWVDGVCN